MPTSTDRQPAENEIECARCGAVFFYELTRCPNCGVNLYEPDDDRQSPKPFKPHPTGLTAKIGHLLRRLSGKSHPAEDLFSQSLVQAGLFNDLLRKVSGDRLTAERLIDFERQRLPDANRTIWIQSAIQHWEKDNH